jgi:predicted neutral ceramidase superfamily lipid hydrolase
MKVTGIEETFRKLKADVEIVQSAAFKKVSARVLTALKEATPVDTGLARDSWKIENVAGKMSITNDQAYVEDLNKGSSKQAPAFFVEKTLLSDNDIKANGSIVVYR